MGYATLSYLRLLFNLFQVPSIGYDLNPSFTWLVEFSYHMWRNSTLHKSSDFHHNQDFHNVRSFFYFFWHLLFWLDLYGFKPRDWGQYRLLWVLTKVVLSKSFESGPSTHFSVSGLTLLYGYYLQICDPAIWFSSSVSFSELSHRSVVSLTCSDLVEFSQFFCVEFWRILKNSACRILKNSVEFFT